MENIIVSKFYFDSQDDFLDSSDDEYEEENFSLLNIKEKFNKY
jgi:hypothetical protein